MISYDTLSSGNLLPASIRNIGIFLRFAAIAVMQLLVSPNIKSAFGFKFKIILSIREIKFPIVSADELLAELRKISGFLKLSCLKKFH